MVSNVYRFGLTLFLRANLILEFWTVFSNRILDVAVPVRTPAAGWWMEVAGEAGWANEIAA